MIEICETNYYMPESWGKNTKGMAAKSEINPNAIGLAMRWWKYAKTQAVVAAKALADLGVHKEYTNRVTEPYAIVDVLWTMAHDHHRLFHYKGRSGYVTAEPWESIFRLRDHPSAQPEFQQLCRRIRSAFEDSTPEQTKFHLPYIDVDDTRAGHSTEALQAISAARCCRVSYVPLDSVVPNTAKDLELAKQLNDDGHMSPFEHVLTAEPGVFANFTNWMSKRWEMEFKKAGDRVHYFDV
jgi:hypothetical protein